MRLIYQLSALNVASAVDSHFDHHIPTAVAGRTLIHDPTVEFEEVVAVEARGPRPSTIESVRTAREDIETCMTAVAGVLAAAPICKPITVELAGVGEVTCDSASKCGSIEILSVTQANKIEGFCTARVLRRLLATESLAAPEYDVLRGIDNNCKAVVMFVDVAAYDLMLGYAWHELPEFENFRIAASLLNTFEKLHRLGVGLGGTGEFSNPNKTGGRILFLNLNNARLLYSEDDGNLLDPLRFAPKDDLLSLVPSSGVVATPLVILQEAIRSHRITEIFPYAYWSDILTRLAGGEDVPGGLDEYPLGKRVMTDAPLRVIAFESYFAECKPRFEQVAIFLKACPGADLSVCPPLGLFEVEGLGAIELEKPKASDAPLEGVSGEVFKSTDRKAAMKVFKSDTCRRRRQEACRERSVLRALNGLTPDVVTERKILSGVDEHCQLVSLVEDFAGEYSVRNVRDLMRTDSPVLFEVLAKLVSVLEKVHGAGFVHNDAHAGNMVYSELRQVAASAKLIDFGFARPFVNAAGEHYVDGRGSRKNDLERLGRILAEKFGSAVPEFLEYFFDIDSLPTEGKPDYQKWIAIFTRLAAERRVVPRLRRPVVPTLAP